jgi:hypothetical protein
MYINFFCLNSVDRNGLWGFRHRMGEASVKDLKYPETAADPTRKSIEDACHSIGSKDVITHEVCGQSKLICRKGPSPTRDPILHSNTKESHLEPGSEDLCAL